MIDAKEKTALATSVGADERQSIQLCNTHIITTENTEINYPDENSSEKLEEIYRQMQRMNDPAYLHTVSMNDLCDCMFDVWMGDIELTTAVLIFSIIVLLPFQLLLCFKVKSKAIRLLPVILLSIPTLIFIGMAITIPGWDGLGYIFLAIFTGFMMFMCGVAWGIWAITKLIKKKKSN